MRTTLTEGNTELRWTLCITLEDTEYADDLALLSHTEDHMQEKTRKLEENARMVGLKINTKKTKLMYLNTERLPVIFVDGKQLDTVDSFNYLGSCITTCITTEGGAERDIKVRIGKARLAFIRLGNIWKTTAFSKKTKLKQLCTICAPIYRSECWRMTDKDINRLSSFHNTSLRMIMKIFWMNKISNKDLHNITNTKDMETLLIQKRWRWLGHVLRKPSEDMTKVVLRWTPEGKRKRGRPKTTWRRTTENEIKERGYTWGTIERKVNNREEWRKLVLALCAMRHSKD
jgi:hypothetical protein